MHILSLKHRSRIKRLQCLPITIRGVKRSSSHEGPPRSKKWVRTPSSILFQSRNVCPFSRDLWIIKKSITIIQLSPENFLYRNFLCVRWRGEVGWIFVCVYINHVPSIDDHAILIHLVWEHSAQHQLQQTQRKQILLVDQTCLSKS